MSNDLTPAESRKTADWLTLNGYIHSAASLRAEADWLEAAARTPARVARLAYERAHHGSRWVEVSEAVVAHHVGPDRVVVDREDVEMALELLRSVGINSSTAARLREALS